MKIEGLHLWNVILVDSDEALWITTRRRNLSDAERKAKAFMRRHRTWFVNAKIKSITNDGTLDA